MADYHKSVFPEETLELLQIRRGKRYIDATLGGGGHTFEILKHGGIVLGIDLDKEAIDYVSAKWKKDSKELGIKENNLVLAKGNFKDLAQIAHSNNFNQVSGILYDLGVSSHQIDAPERGFSFSKEGPLDMRMDQESPVRASDLINILTKGELNEIFYRLGEEHRARAISDGIVRARRLKPIQTTEDLTEIVQEAYGIRSKTLSPFMKANINKKVFQALRIAVNSELENLQDSLPQTLDLLEKGGRVAIITFHSLEDRIVKLKFKEFAEKKT